MKKFLALVLILLLPLTTLADGPDGFSAELQHMTDAEFAARCEAFLADTSLNGSSAAVRGAAKSPSSGMNTMPLP